VKLRFVPKGDALCALPIYQDGAYPFVGRSFDADSRANKAHAEPAVITAYKADGRTLTDEASRCIELAVRDGDLLPFDAETAAFCGLPFKAVEHVDGEWNHAGKAAE
jgi:hypothetical protein